MINIPKLLIPAVILAAVFYSGKVGNAQSQHIPQNLSYEALIDSAENLTHLNLWSEASELYRQALRINPASPINSKIFANLGLCLTHTGNYDEALEAYDIALVKEPNSASILSGKGATLLIKGDITSARMILEEALAVDSLAPTALRLHGQIMLMENNHQIAESDFSRLTKADPADAWGHAGIAEVKMARNLYQEAIPLFVKALQLQESSDFRLSMIAAMLKSNHLADAEKAIREALAIYPQQGEFYLLRALLHKTLHQNRDMELDKKYAVEYGVDPQIIERYLNSY
ncbi:MAG: tetratricopeptide repeat protein [Muribaculaceae bacterium]|nr:tetratricopeptide repeat protein [Muribaculaceae bacterium]